MASYRNEIQESLNKLSESCNKLTKHFSPRDSRWHTAPATHDELLHEQKPHGNRPGDRTMHGILSSYQLLPNSFSSGSPANKLSYFLKATGYAEPVLNAGGSGGDFFAAPKGTSFLPAQKQGQNETVNSPYTKSLAIKPNPKLELGKPLTMPKGASVEDKKRYVEAVAEHVKNDYKPAESALYNRFKDNLDKLTAPEKAEDYSSSSLTPAKRIQILQDLVAEANDRNAKVPYSSAVASFKKAAKKNPSGDEVSYLKDSLALVNQGM